MIDARNIFTRYPENPILNPRDYPGINTLFNPSPVRYGEKVVLLVSATTNVGCQGISHRETFYAESTDGVHFTLDTSKPFIDQRALPKPLDRMGGIIDNRLTPIDGAFYGIAPMGTWEIGMAEVAGLMYRTDDFKTIEFLGLTTLPYNRGCSLFPERVNGLYRRLERPNAGSDPGSIWISQSPDLMHWGNYQPLLTAGWSAWNSAKIGPTPPHRTSEGWLFILHGVESSSGGKQYYIGAALLDLDDPTRLIGKTQSWILAPEAACECHGAVPNVVFPCGCLIDEDRDEVLLYYGGADTTVCLASGKLSELIECCKNGW